MQTAFGVDWLVADCNPGRCGNCKFFTISAFSNNSKLSLTFSSSVFYTQFSDSFWVLARHLYIWRRWTAGIQLHQLYYHKDGFHSIFKIRYRAWILNRKYERWKDTLVSWKKLTFRAKKSAFQDSASGLISIYCLYISILHNRVPRIPIILFCPFSVDFKSFP